MARFCSNCGRSLQEGEVCNCRQVNLGTGQATGQTNGQANGQQNNPNMGYYQPYTPKKAGIPKLLVPIGQTVTGGVLILFGLITGGWDWSYISYVTGAGFLLTGICGIIEERKSRK